MEKIKYLGIIPARGGSKGIPGKNIKMIAGKPLLAWTIEAAKASSLMDRFVVSTDDPGIKEVALEYGAEVIDRPAELATDTADTWSVLQHVLEQVPAEAVVLLQPTSPVRDKDLIDRCIQRYIDIKADNVATGFICKYMEYGSYDKRRQELKGFFYDDGNVYVVNADLVRAGKRTGDKIELMYTSREENVEIDDEYEFWLAEQVLLKRNQEGK
ncbi:cytidylyltransferase domain-containing protein [Candidatus Margulisiibacteriota bacterium]